MSTRISLASPTPTVGDPSSSSLAGPSAPVPELSLRLAGSVIRTRYRVNAVSSVNHAVVVYSAEDTHKGRSIALKVLRDVFARDAEFVAAVRAQALALATSAHVLRGVQRVYESGETETGQLFVALEWVEGATLCDVLDAGGALAAPTALRIAIRVGEALEALHHNRLVYGRLGPDSVVMVNDGERIRVLGAELAAAYRTPISRSVQDPFPLAYRAPEQAEHGDATEATDVYALGMLLRQLLTAGKDEPTPLSPTIQRIIATALEPRPERRYPDMSVMVNDIWGAAALVIDPESRPRSRASANARRRVRRRRKPFALRMAAAVAAAGVTAAIVWVAGVDPATTWLHSRVTPPAGTAIRVEDGALPLPAPREATAAPESGAVENTAPVERPAPVVVHESEAARPAAMAPRSTPPAIAPPTVDGRPRAVVESPAPVAPRPPVVSRTPAEPRPPATVRSSSPERPTRSEPEPDSADGSAAIDWLLKTRR